MADGPGDKRAARLLFATGLVLLAATLGSFWVGDRQAAPGIATTGLVVGIATLKAHLVAGVFMELRDAPRVWAVAMSGFLLAQAALIIALFT